MLSTIYNRLYAAWSNYNTKKKLDTLFKRYSNRVKLRPLTTEQIDEIQNYYQSVIGRKVDTRWHQLLYSITGHFTPRYMPFDVYHKMLEKMSPWKYIKILDDKNLYRQFFHGFTLPERIVECSLGKYLLIENQQIKIGGDKKETAIHCSNAGECIIKPSVASSAGNGVKKVNFVNGFDTTTQTPVEEILTSCGQNFVVEKAVVENENLRKLNPSSCNTIRIHTYRDVDSGEIKFISAFLRIGRNGQFVDNGGAGGICVSLNKNGRCIGTAWIPKTFSSITYTDNGIEINQYQIDFFEEIVNTAINAHKGLYHFDLIGWDIAVNDKNEVVIIEFNPNPDLRLDQVWFKDTCLKECQEEILKSIYKM